MKKETKRDITIYTSTHILAISIVLIVIFATLTRQKQISYAENMYNNALKMIKGTSNRDVNKITALTYDNNTHELIFSSHTNTEVVDLSISMSFDDTTLLFEEMTKDTFKYTSYSRSYFVYELVSDNEFTYEYESYCYDIYKNGSNNYMNITYFDNNDNTYKSYSSCSYDINTTHTYTPNIKSLSVIKDNNNVLSNFFDLILSN